jgi:hypothetical protein
MEEIEKCHQTEGCVIYFGKACDGYDTRCSHYPDKHPVGVPKPPREPQPIAAAEDTMKMEKLNGIGLMYLREHEDVKSKDVCGTDSDAPRPVASCDGKGGASPPEV